MLPVCFVERAASGISPLLCFPGVMVFVSNRAFCRHPKWVWILSCPIAAPLFSDWERSGPAVLLPEVPWSWMGKPLPLPTCILQLWLSSQPPFAPIPEKEQNQLPTAQLENVFGFFFEAANRSKPTLTFATSSCKAVCTQWCPRTLCPWLF